MVPCRGNGSREATTGRPRGTLNGSIWKTWSTPVPSSRVGRPAAAANVPRSDPKRVRCQFASAPDVPNVRQPRRGADIWMARRDSARANPRKCRTDKTAVEHLREMRDADTLKATGSIRADRRISCRNSLVGFSVRSRFGSRSGAGARPDRRRADFVHEMAQATVCHHRGSGERCRQEGQRGRGKTGARNFAEKEAFHRSASPGLAAYRGKKRSGRGERIRTSDSCVPNAVLYQAELHPDDTAGGQIRATAAASRCAAFESAVAADRKES